MVRPGLQRPLVRKLHMRLERLTEAGVQYPDLTVATRHVDTRRLSYLLDDADPLAQ
jgi:hypothetical protein